MSTTKFNEQAEKLKSLVGSAKLQTTSQVTSAAELANGSHDGRELESSSSVDASKPAVDRPEPPKTKAKNLKTIPVSYFEAHADLKATSKTSLDFSSYIMEAIREKLERDGAL